MKHRTILLAAACLAAVVLTWPAPSVAGCTVDSGVFCVCCPPSECRVERDVCPGGAGGLLVLKVQNPECSVRAYDPKSCVSGGMVASERRSDLSVYRKGAAARIDLSNAQLEDLVRQLRELAK